MMPWAPWILSMMVAAWFAAAITHRRIMNWTIVALAAVLIVRNAAGLP